jgi:hypothetical protein
MMGKLENVLVKRDEKVLNVAREFVRLHGFTVSWNLETIDELNELISKDGLKLDVELVSSDKIVRMYQKGKVVREKKVYIVDDEIFAD